MQPMNELSSMRNFTRSFGRTKPKSAAFTVVPQRRGRGWEEDAQPLKSAGSQVHAAVAQSVPTISSTDREVGRNLGYQHRRKLFWTIRLWAQFLPSRQCRGLRHSRPRTRYPGL